AGQYELLVYLSAESKGERRSESAGTRMWLAASEGGDYHYGAEAGSVGEAFGKGGSAVEGGLPSREDLGEAVDGGFGDLLKGGLAVHGLEKEEIGLAVEREIGGEIDAVGA